MILKEFYELLILKHTRVEELNLESVHGISGTIGRGMNKAIFTCGVLLLGGSWYSNAMLGRYAGGMTTALLIFGVMLMIVSLLFPYMTFSVIGMGSDHTSLATGINVQGKSLLGNGVLFQARPVEGAGESIAEAGACVFDLRTYGDEAMKKWARE
ncbi:MAG: hypothetical protein Q4B09_11585 [Lachnospiraceae bacterium]|nr:hypothetical protein [Lachnospiraceae bacterium]